jgi:hypothetical protein
MPMLHSCSLPSCETLTLSTYCFEHERVIRARADAERAQVADRDQAIARESAGLRCPPATQHGLSSS